MVRSNSDIATIIAGLKTNRAIRDTAIEAAAAALDSSDSINAARLRDAKHTVEISNDIKLCVECKIKKDSAGDVLGVVHIRYRLVDNVSQYGDGGSQTLTTQGLNTILVDEAVTVTGATTVENL